MNRIRRRIVGLPCLVALLLPLTACGAAGLLPGVSSEKLDVAPGQAMSETERDMAIEVYHLVNAERAHADLPPLLWSEPAASAAYLHCVDMRVRDFYDHVAPDGGTPCMRLRAAGLDPDACGAENIARGEDSAAEVMAAWMASPAHRQNVLHPTATHLGVGVHAGADGPWWTQEFFRADAPRR